MCPFTSLLRTNSGLGCVRMKGKSVQVHFYIFISFFCCLCILGDDPSREDEFFGYRFWFVPSLLVYPMYMYL